MPRDLSPAFRLFQKTIALAAGLDGETPALSGITPPSDAGGKAHDIMELLKALAAGREYPFSFDQALMKESCNTAVKTFTDYYSRKSTDAEEKLNLLERAAEPEEKARLVAEIWAPELAVADEEILPRWRLKDCVPHPVPVRPTEVVLQLNALYTLPEESCHDPRRKTLPDDPGPPAAHYDHPVHLYETGHHELITCLKELDRDLAFEKEQGVFPRDYRLPVLVSLSVTHPVLDQAVETWVRDLLRKGDYRHMEILLLTERACRKIDGELFQGEAPFFTVLGAYGAHFNALKYAQLLLEPSRGIRGGFKLDTDEGIHSRDLFEATGKTWFQTLCHPYWGGRGRDWQNREVLLGVNEGEYVNEKDVREFGYAGALRKPDVLPPKSCLGSEIFFLKGMAHGRTTGLYNRFDRLDDLISHPVVKGGGYGITNEALRLAAPFTLSVVGRAEDQQFYFSGLPGGIRGIFHPNLRIVHYKDRVGKSEKKTELTRFAGDMFRLVLFSHLVEILDVKEDIDPMPGIFASPLAGAQSFFHTLMKTYSLSAAGKEDEALYLLEEVLQTLQTLRRDIANGSIKNLFFREREQWCFFIKRVSDLKKENLQRILSDLRV
ncbi:MAG: hypothetical protein JW760_12820 [Spirochaetales bacterium]|nr:hypothetical protein [Spirochaetales bacterium]